MAGVGAPRAHVSWRVIADVGFSCHVDEMIFSRVDMFLAILAGACLGFGLGAVAFGGDKLVLNFAVIASLPFSLAMCWRQWRKRDRAFDEKLEDYKKRRNKELF